MKKLLFLFLLLLPVNLYAQTRTSQCGTPCDDFNRASLGTTNWTQMNTAWGNMTIVSSTNVYGNGGDSVMNVPIAKWIGTGTFTDDQYAKLVVSNLQNLASEAYSAGVCVEITGTDSSESAYCVHVDGLNASPYHTRLWKIVSGTATSIATGTFAWVDGDTIQLNFKSSTGEVSALRNGVALGSSFTHICSSSCPSTGGVPGINGGGTSTGFLGDNFEAGTITFGGGGGATFRHRIYQN